MIYQLRLFQCFQSAFPVFLVTAPIVLIDASSSQSVPILVLWLHLCPYAYAHAVEPFQVGPYALATFSSLCELTIMRMSFLLEQLVHLPDMGL